MIEDIYDIEPGTILETDDYSSMQVLKRISDGYLVLEYESPHYVYNVLYKSFDEIADMHVSENDWDNYLFDAKQIKHIDDFGFCKNIDKE